MNSTGQQLRDQLSRICKNCQWWDRKGTEYGTCQRFPPQVRIQYSASFKADYTGKHSEFVNLNAYGSNEGEFPTTHQDTWCGEHKPYEKKPE